MDVPRRPNAGSYRLLTRFLRLLLPVFMIASVAGLWAVGQQSFGDERNVLAARIGNVAARTATALNRLPAGTSQEQTDSILAVALGDPAVSCVVVLDENRKMLASAPSRIGCRGAEQDAFVEMPLAGSIGKTLCVKYNLFELEQRSAIVRTFTMMALFFSLLFAALAAWISFRITVGKPVRNLLTAIHATRDSGKPRLVVDVPDDELGEVIQAFNEMQTDVAAKTAGLSGALKRLDYLYNEMPALMFTVNDAGQIETISGHWTEAVGYKKTCMAGKPVGAFLSTDNGIDIGATLLAAEGHLRDIPATLKGLDGRRIDVLLSMVKDDHDGKSSRLCVLSDVSGLRAAQAELQRQALTDHLTGMPNRKALSEHLARLKPFIHAGRQRVAVLFIDLDDFKAVNDGLGHEAGDQLLIAASKRLRNCVAEKDFVARLGGDEFAVVLSLDDAAGGAAAVAERIIETIARPFRLGADTAHVGASVGIALSQAGAAESGDLLRLADLAMYKSKQGGKNRLTVYSPDLPRAA